MEPPHDIQINADKIQLANFLLFLKKVWNNEVEDVPHTTKLPTLKNVNSNKLEISKKSQYPTLQGFPSNLQTLIVSKNTTTQ